MKQHPGIVLLRALAPLPLGVVRALGTVIGQVLFIVARSRRRIALRNLELCFPHLSAAERRALARRNFVVFSQALLDRAWVWHADPEVVRRRLKLTGAVDDLRRAGAVVIFAPHFYGMDAGGSAVMQQIGRPGSTIYSTQPNPAVDAWMRAGRARFGEVLVIPRSDGLRPVVRALREGRLLYLLPDMDLGAEESIFVPFFGVPAATVPSVPRLAGLGRARVVPVTTRMTANGYEVRVHPAWRDYPTDDIVADTAYMNQQLQGYIAEMPEQYYWVHRRFKTRPAGEPPVY